MSKMIDDYFEIYTEKVKEFGENTVVLHQTGSFYEIYEINNANEIIGNAKNLTIKCSIENRLRLIKRIILTLIN